MAETEPTRCRHDNCPHPATHGPGDDAVACWGHAGDWPRVVPLPPASSGRVFGLVDLEEAERWWGAHADGAIALARQARNVDEWKRAMSMAGAARSVEQHLFFARIAARDFTTGEVSGYGYGKLPA